MGEAKTHYGVIVVGAGVASIYQIKRLIELGIDATVLDSAAGLGDTWCWNRYPGCRFDLAPRLRSDCPVEYCSKTKTVG